MTGMGTRKVKNKLPGCGVIYTLNTNSWEVIVVGLYAYVEKMWRAKRGTATRKILTNLLWERRQQWRRQHSIVRIERPTRIDRARKLGYKAKQGFVLARVRIRRGTRRKIRPNRGRRSKRMGVNKFTPSKSRQWLAEQRVERKFPNLRVLNSYWVGADGMYKWFEVVLVDPNHPVIQSDSRINWICDPAHKGRAARGLTSAGKKSRGLHKKGVGAEKIRPSLASHRNRGK
jgi:large subunit ribosomal protein L15e